LTLSIDYVTVYSPIVSKITTINIIDLQKLEISNLSIFALQLREIFISIEKNLKSAKIKYLFHSESIQTIAKSCPSLQEITIYYCEESSFCLEKFISIFQNCQQLNAFDFSNWSVEALEEDLQPSNTFVKIFSYFPNCKNLEEDEFNCRNGEYREKKCQWNIKHLVLYKKLRIEFSLAKMQIQIETENELDNDITIIKQLTKAGAFWRFFETLLFAEFDLFLTTITDRKYKQFSIFTGIGDTNTSNLLL
ncbi:19644_t:CDS:2, partial [Racocetra persica]